MMLLILKMSCLNLKAVQIRAFGLLRGLLTNSLDPTEHVLKEHILWRRSHRVVSKVRLGLLILKNDYISVKTAESSNSYAFLPRGTSDNQGKGSGSA